MFELLPEMPLAAKFFAAFLIVLGLIALTAWLVRRLGANRLGGGGARGRQPRLAVIDAASVDGRRRLVLIRRDNIEHLLMIGGPTDVVVEQNIVRAAGARDQTRLPAAGEGLPRAVPGTENNGWPLQPTAEIAPGPAMPPVPPPQQPTVARPSRAAPVEDSWAPMEPPAPRQRMAPAVPSPAPELSARFAAPELSVPPPPPDNTIPSARDFAAPEPAAAQSDRNLAEMAMRLEAALRNPKTGEGKAPDPFSVPIPPQRAPEPPRTVSREPSVPTESKPASPSKSPFDSLEQEMASLLGRSSPKT